VDNPDYIIFGAPDIQQAEIDEVVTSMQSGWLGTGPKVARFEHDFAAYKGIDEHQVAAVNSCTAALHLSIIAAGLTAGDEVITTAMTFCATVNAIIHAGATPVLADIDPVTLNIDPAAIERAITPRTRAIVPVHFAGRPCDMTAIMALADRYQLKVIEDCAHAIEGEYHGQKIGTFGDFGCFSFYVTKNVVTGEGGMVVARREADIARIKTLALHGMSKDAWRRFSDSGYKHYQVVECGFKYNMMDLQAAIGIHQLARVEASWQRRLAIWHFYQRELADLPVTLPAPFSAESRHALHLFTLRVDRKECGIDRDTLLDRLHHLGIGCGVHYLSIAEHPYYQQRFGWRGEDYPIAMAVGRTTISLPLSAGLGEAQLRRVVSALGQSLAP
jgi:dTDP-4-amino-4,6-dideoxygalactose transaminase